MANVKVSEWNFILNINVSHISSTLLNILNVIKASSCSCKSSSLSILEVDLDFVIGHTLQHLMCQFEPSKRFDVGFICIVKKLDSVTSTWTTLKGILTNFTLLVVIFQFIAVLASNFVD